MDYGAGSLRVGGSRRTMPLDAPAFTLRSELVTSHAEIVAFHPLQARGRFPAEGPLCRAGQKYCAGRRGGGQTRRESTNTCSGTALL